MKSLNSTMVRLQQYPAELEKLLKQKQSQFHYGSITTHTTVNSTFK